MTNEVTAPELAAMCAAEGVPVTRQHISRLCRQGQISGAYQVGGRIKKTWVIPYDAARKFITEKKSLE